MRFILLLLTLFLSEIFQAQTISYSQLTQLHTNTDASVVNAIWQDSSGLIWMGTNSGLLSFDGYTFQTHYVYGQESNVRIYDEVQDGHFFYLATDNGILCYDYQTDRYTPLPIRFPNDTRCLLLTGRTLWIGTLHGLYSFHLDQHTQRAYTPETHGLPHAAIYSLLQLTDGRLLVGTYDGLCSLSKGEKFFRRIELPHDQTHKNQFINALLEDTLTHCVWIGMEGNLIRYDLTNEKGRTIDTFQHNSVKSLNFDSDHHLLIGTDNGLFVYNYPQSHTTHILHDSRDSHSLTNNIVWCIFTDKNHNVWIGSDNGVSIAQSNKLYKFTSVWQICDSREGNQFYSILNDSKGNRWLGGSDGLILVPPRPTAARWYKMGKKDFPISHNRIRHIYEDREHNVWIATDGSIERYNPQNQQFIHYHITDSTHTYNANWAYSILEDAKGQLWIGTCLGGIFRVDKQKLIHSKGDLYLADENYTTKDGLKSMFVSQIVPDSVGNIWILPYNHEIQKLHINNGHITSYTLSTDQQVIPSFILCDQAGFIWAGSHNMVYCIDPRLERHQAIKLTDSSNLQILSIAEAEGYIWISTTQGIWTVEKSTHDIHHLQLAEQLFTHVYYDSQHHTILLGGNDGIGECQPAIIHEKEQPVQILLTRITVNGKPFTSDQSVRYCKEAEVTHTQNNFVFSFSDFPYTRSGQTSFVYKLEGVDETWHNLLAHSNQITYNNLEHGTYQLFICKAEDTNSAQPLFTLTILPPWYYTIYAKLCYLILTLALILWIINFFRVKSRLRLEKMEKEQILKQSQQKMNFLSNISHDLKTPVSMIVSPLSKLRIDTHEGPQKSMIDIAYRNALLLNEMIHKLLEFNRIDNAQNTLFILSRVELVSLLRKIYSYFQDADLAHTHQWEFHSNMESLYMDVDAIKMDSIFRNLLSNAVKYTPEGGKIQLDLTYSSSTKEVCITFEDTGIGIPSNELPYIFQRFFQSPRTQKTHEGTGIGLYLVKNYTEVHHGTINVTSQEGKGTRFVLTFPIDENLQHETHIQNVPSSPSSVTPGTDHPLILVVDDNLDMHELIPQILGESYRFLTASNGKEGLNLAEKYSPSLIISDYMMPIMDGIEMSRLLKKQASTFAIPILMLTAKDDPQTKNRSLKSNIDAFISKPFEAELLRNKVAQMLRSKTFYESQARISHITTPKEEENLVSQDEKFLMTITQLIEDHISDSDLNVNTLCNLSGSGSKQIYRKVKQLTGMSPVEYIKSIRMKKAAMLLKQKKFTIAEVMYMVGYSNPSYFSKCFQATFGCTPKQYDSVL